jgi:predicted nucleic acid-binding protein
LSNAAAYVADASVWINLAATGRAAEHLRAIGKPMLITDTALGELDRGRPKGRQAADEVQALIHIGLLEVVHVPASQEELFFSLVAGSAQQTLDDGEAATLAFANAGLADAIIDEQKATELAASRLPNLRLSTTTDLLLSVTMIETLGISAVADSLLRALQLARMRVPKSRMDEVVALIGLDQARQCPSLPAAVRGAAGAPTV